jgi:secondary thiamine-phosphate synthase enzyme
MTVQATSFKLSTRGDADIHDITNQIAEAVHHSGLQTGTVTVFCPSSTSAVTTIENESGALDDLRRLFDEIISPKRDYAHNARWHDGNGHSHIRASLLGPSWQQVIYVDFDNRPRQRELILEVIGE